MQFDEKKCEEYVRMLIDHDEVERGLMVLDNVPAYFRDYLPDNLKKLRNDIKASLITTHAYLSSGLDADVTEEKATLVLENTTRGKIIQQEVKRYNDAGLTPHIVDMGPGEYFVPIGLLKTGAKFTYHPIVLDQNAQRAAHSLIKDTLRSEPLEDQPVIFLALEVVEHLPHTDDILIECLRHCKRLPERLHFSTPCYTYDLADKDWNKPCGLPHLRAYTPKEFIEEMRKMFSDYVWQLYDGPILSLRGMRGDRIDDKALF